MEEEPRRERHEVPIWFLSFLVTLAYELEKINRDDSDPLGKIAKILRKIATPTDA